MAEYWMTVKVHPNAGKDVLVNVGPGRFEAWVKAKPMDGQANAAVIRLLARALEVPQTSVRLTKGRSGRHKVFRIIAGSQVTSDK